MDDFQDQPEDRMDLSSLMPSPERFEAMAQSVLARLAKKRVRMRDALPAQLLRWAGPVLGAGAAAALCLFVIGSKPEPTTDSGSTAFTQWALANEAPSTNRIFETLESGEDAQP